MNSQEIWQIQVQDRIYEASYSEVIQWIKEGSILPEDKVRRGNLRWLEARKVPDLNRHFLEREGEPTAAEAAAVVASPEMKDVYTHFQIGAGAGPGGSPSLSFQYAGGVPDIQMPPTGGFNADGGEYRDPKALPTVCSNHAERNPVFICDICRDLFCKQCPNSFGSNVKLCPHCGGLCVAFNGWEYVKEKTHGAVNKPYPRLDLKTETVELEAKLQTRDFLNALKNPFRFPRTLLLGTALFTLLVFGQVFSMSSDVLAITASVGIAILLVMLTFSILLKNRENFVHGEPEASFLPRLNRFTLWEDFLHPFWLGIGVYLVAFGLFFSVVSGAGAYAWFKFSSELETVESAIRQTHNEMKTSAIADEPRGREPADLEKVIAERRQDQIESVLGINYFGGNQQLKKIAQSFMRLSLHFHMPVCFVLILGILFFPAASLVAIQTRSFAKTVNPLAGLRAMRSLGFDYFKLLFVGLVFLVVVSSSVIGAYLAFSMFDQFLTGILAAIVLGSVYSFYFWLVFSYLLGTAAHKSAEKLEMI